MGGKKSTPEPPPAPPAPSPCFEAPWRNIEWGNKEQEMKWLDSFQPENDTMKHLRILLYGPAGNGKSSFVNSVSSTCQNRITSPAMVDANSAQSFTIQYKTHRIRKGNSGQHYPFVFNDLMGLEEAGGGVREEDIKLAMKGHVRDGYKFNSASPMAETDQFYNSSPDTSDKVNIVVCVLNANSDIKAGFIAKMRTITMAARDCGIPQIAILTKIDERCPLVKKSIRDVYLSKRIKEKMEEYHGKLGIPLCAMFPVKNYHEEQDVNADIDMLILRALKQIILQASDSVNE